MQAAHRSGGAFVAPSARQIERVAGVQFVDRFLALVPSRARGLTLDRQRHDRLAHVPLLRALDLQHERVVRIVVQREALFARRCQIDVGLDVDQRFALDRIAQCLQPRAEQCRIADQQSVTALEPCGDRTRIEHVDRRLPGVVGANRRALDLQFGIVDRRTTARHREPAAVARTDVDGRLDVGNAIEVAEIRCIAARDVQRLAFEVALKERRDGGRRQDSRKIHRLARGDIDHGVGSSIGKTGRLAAGSLCSTAGPAARADGSVPASSRAARSWSNHGSNRRFAFRREATDVGHFAADCRFPA